MEIRKANFEKPKVVIAIDSFKGSMSSLEAGNAAKAGIEESLPYAECVVKALADGGEGTYKILLNALGGEEISVLVKDPLGRDTIAHYGILADKTGVLEMAEASGLALLKPSEFNPLEANTFGFGQMIVDAYNRGVRNFIIGIGGSATTEAGIGMLEAFGCRFYDKNLKQLAPTLDNLDMISSIDLSNVDNELFNINISLACDVTNPLCGNSGAVAVFGPQKGVRRDQIELFDKKISHFAKLVCNYTNTDMTQMSGAGAAGGLGFTLASFFKNITVKSGADLIIEKLDIEKEIMDADIVITGEGRIDNQTAGGKGPGKIAALGKKYNCKVYGFSGILNVSYEKCLDIFDDIIQIKPASMSIETAMVPENAIKNMTYCVRSYFVAADQK